MRKKTAPPVSAANIVRDIKRVASEIHRTPTRDEYTGRTGQKLGHYSEHAIKKFFADGGYAAALAKTGLVGSEMLKITDEAGFQVATIKSQLDEAQKYIKELESETLSASAARKLIGAIDTTKFSGNADWIRGPKELKIGVTGIPTLFISDVHLDEVVDPSEINGVNEFNRDIGIQRLRHTFTTAIDLTKRYLVKPQYDGFICAFGGDIVSGMIHEELAETNDARINETIMLAVDIFIEGLTWLKDEFKQVFVPCVVGNHGRMHKKPRYKHQVKDNHEWLIYQFVARHFKNDPKVSFLIPDAPDAQWTCYGRTYNLNHGHEFKGGTGIAGLFSPLMLGMARKQKKQNGIGRPFDVMMNGHWHQYIHTDNLIVNGSVKGYDEFANSHNFPFEPPQQALFISHPVKRETFRMPILCDETPRIKTNLREKLSWEK